MLTVMVNGVASDATGTLSGAGLTKTGTGVYTLTSGSPADVTTRLRALVFTAAVGITAPQATTISVQASDGILTTTDTATSLLVSPVDASGPTGQGWGDVHMVTFKGLAYDFMAVGDYTLVKSVEPGNAFDIQIRTSGEHGVMSYTTEIAAQVGANTVDFELDGAVKLNGVATPIAVGSVRKIDGGTISRTKDDTYVVNWETGESLKVVNKGGEYFDEMVSLGPNARPGSVVGLLGANTTQANDIQLADGTVLHNPTNDELVGAYASSWSVGTDLSLLDDGGLLPAAMSNLGDAATPFNGKSSIDLAGFDASKATLAFSEDAAGGFGTLTVTSGSQHTAILLMGQYAAAGFGLANDGHGGTTIDYQPPRPTLLG
ncbi:VWD domain-containing protein [Methyloraptor flagellatus]|uniref:VWD domain-containing protein n=1 Tax=Methyloraptor flagellatus TaxID=3162530 RepID=A0AAU7XFX9_9HYPH